MLGALLTGAAAVFALVAAAMFTLVAFSGGTEGTVVAKSDQGSYDYPCQAGGTVTGPVAVPAWGACSVPECWRLVVRDSDGNTSEPCVSREEYDRTHLGAFWRGRTDR
jgi:hypothetical protein